MTTEPFSGAPDWVSVQASPWLITNKAQRMIAPTAAYGIIEDRDLSAPPGSCADGAAYLIAATGSGAWTLQTGKLAIAVGVNAASGWYFRTVAVEGFKLYVRDEGVEITHDGAAWVTTSTGGTVAASQVTYNNSNLYAGTVEQALDELLALQSYRVGFFFTSAPTASEVLCIHTFTDSCSFPANFHSPDSGDYVGTNPAGSFVLTFKINGTTIGTLTISTAGVSTWATTGSAIIHASAGETLIVTGPAGADATIANVAVTLRGYIV